MILQRCFFLGCKRHSPSVLEEFIGELFGALSLFFIDFEAPRRTSASSLLAIC
jgi:hypothetical protein